MVIRVYIDGFNLYYGRLHHQTQYVNEIRRKLRWLNPDKLVRLFIKDKTAEIKSICFFTADITALYVGDKGPSRQQEYYRALSTLDNLSIIKGRFSKNHTLMPVYPLEVCERDGNFSVKKQSVLKTAEKRSDVNLASHLLFDACQNKFDLAIIITNDSDLLEPIKLVRRLNKEFLILSPHLKYCHDFVMNFHKSSMRKISQSDIEKSQFDDVIVDAAGEVKATRPRKWM
jgi:uncharacterized LabA/DUF88 family protein